MAVLNPGTTGVRQLTDPDTQARCRLLFSNLSSPKVGRSLFAKIKQKGVSSRRTNVSHCTEARGAFHQLVTQTEDLPHSGLKYCSVRLLETAPMN